MYITMRWDADFNTRMSWEGEKSGASGPTDSIRKMPPRGPVDQVSHSVTMRSNQPAAFCTQRGHEFLSARKTASLYAGVPLSFSRSISIPAAYSRCLNGKSERLSRARTEVRKSVIASSYSCNARATSALSITVLLSRCHSRRRRRPRHLQDPARSHRLGKKAGPRFSCRSRAALE
jgi:hypothetical protein